MISNYISLQASDSIIENYVVYDYVQLEQAVISGGEIGFHYHPHFAHFLHLESAYSMLYTATNKETALDLIPQNRLLTSLKFTFRKINEHIKINHLTLEHQAFEATDRFGMNETRSPSYQLLNIGTSSSFTWKQQQIEVNLGVKNIFNEAFIPHTSQLKNFNLSQPGRSFYIQFIINLNSKK
jgi:iron complex outermembrane receptor protein